MTITALLTTHSARAGQRQCIERRAIKETLTIDAWVRCDAGQLGDLSWGSGDTVILADAHHGLVNDCASIAIQLFEDWLKLGVTVLFANTGDSLTPDQCQQPDVMIRIIADSLHTSTQTLRRQEKARAAVKRRKAAGLPVGRTPGTLGRHKLDRHGKTIHKRLGQGVSKAALAKQLGVSRSTLYVWLQRQQRE